MNDRLALSAVQGRELGNDFLSELRRSADGHRAHVFTHALPNAPENRGVDLLSSAEHGQAPVILLYRHPDDPFGALGEAAPRIFHRSSTVIAKPRAHELVIPNGDYAAYEYATRHLNVKKVQVLGSNENPTASEVVAYFTSEARDGVAPDIGPFNKPLMERARPIYVEALQAAREVFGSTCSDVAVRRMACFALARHNAQGVRELAQEQNDVSVDFLYVDASTGTGLLRRLDMDASLAELHSGAGEHMALNRQPRLRGDKRWRSWFCCDAREDHSIFRGVSDEPYISNLISIFIPPHRDVPEGFYHQAWASIEDDIRIGNLMQVILGHYDCGGVKAAITRAETGYSAGKYIDPWLDQAIPVVRRALEFVKKYEKKSGNKLSPEQVLKLATMRVKIWSARNVARYIEEQTGAPAQEVYAQYLDLKTREVEMLGIGDSKAETLRRVLGRSPVQYLTTRCDPSEIVRARPDAMDPWKDSAAKQARIDAFLRRTVPVPAA